MSDTQKFNIATGLTSIRETTGWWYRITPMAADRSFNYRVEVFLDGHEKGVTYADTKRGGRRAARMIRTRFYRRSRMTPEVGPLENPYRGQS